MAIQDAPSIMFARYQLLKRIPGLFTNKRWSLTRDLTKCYEIYGHHCRAPPFHVEFVYMGPCMGWRWTNCTDGGSCKLHWLDVEPKQTNPEYAKYCKELETHVHHDGVGFYEGFTQPPTQQEHAQLSADIPLDPMQCYNVTMLRLYVTCHM
eukprot:scaffold82058_cov62-Attheya_sp.AAC.2